MIVRAEPNPVGDDETGEGVELRNVSAADIDLRRWEPRDLQGRAHRLAGVLKPGEARRVDIP
ncbi:MAG TPA: hypothetical protein VF590_03045, partial [Isosphaeraceae bacterium]